MPVPLRADTGKMSSPTPSSDAACSACTMCGRSRRSTLLRAMTTGHGALASTLAIQRSPGPTPCSALSTISATSVSLSSRSTRRCMRTVRLSSGRCTPGRSVSTSCASSRVATPRIARRVVCGLSDTIATFWPTIALTSVDLPTFGRPARATSPARVFISLTTLISSIGAGASLYASSRPEAERAGRRRRLPRQDLSLHRQHLTVVDLVVHPDEVQGPMHDGLADVLGVRGADDDVAELARTGDVGLGLVDRERQDVCRPLLAAPLRVELRDPLRVDERDRHVPLEDARRGDGERHQPDDLRFVRQVVTAGCALGVEHLDLQRHV